MALVALVVLVAWLILLAGVPTYRSYRRTGAVVAPVRPEPRSWAWWARVNSSLGVAFAFAAPVAELAGLAPFVPADRDVVHYAGVALALTGIVGALGAQAAMAEAWRPDVDPQVRTQLVTTGPFRVVRNPILTCTAATALGLALIVPNVLAMLMLATIIVGLQVQVRLVEEPYLVHVHGETYRRYAARTGRFLPWIGRRLSA